MLDLETTGTWIEKDRIIEMAMIKCLPDGTRETYDQRFNPTIPIPPVVTELTGISNEAVRNEPLFKAKAKEILEFIGDADLSGFNVERFDLPLLENELNRAGLKFERGDRTIYDVQKIFHLNEKRDLTAAYRFYCEKDLEDAHSAMADTAATLEILEQQVKRYGEGEAKDALSSLQRFNYQRTAEFYDADRRFRWWNGRLYMMFGKYAKQLSLQDVAKKDPRYLDWILSADFSPEIKELVAGALKGQFPIYSE